MLMKDELFEIRLELSFKVNDNFHFNSLIRFSRTFYGKWNREMEFNSEPYGICPLCGSNQHDDCEIEKVSKNAIITEITKLRERVDNFGFGELTILAFYDDGTSTTSFSQVIDSLIAMDTRN